MIRVKRKQLEVVSKYIDVNNPKFELNYLYIDGENLISTNTRALAVVKHYGDTKEEFAIHKSIVLLALKQTKTYEFELEKNKIVCFDRNDCELITISIGTLERDGFFKYPEYSRIIPKETEKKIPFIQSSSIDGILAINRVVVDNKYIPTLETKNDDFFNGGYVGINKYNLPITISDTRNDFIIVIMPTVAEFPIFREDAPVS